MRELKDYVILSYPYSMCKKGIDFETVDRKP